jgi:hypothetical protein
MRLRSVDLAPQLVEAVWHPRQSSRSGGID